MKSITAKGYKVEFTEKQYIILNEFLNSRQYSSVFVLADSNTEEHCLPLFLSNLSTESSIEIISIEAGEENKHIETCSGVWSALSELGADRKSILINLGGGVVTDLGGFVASTFKRGIDFINIPTTLLSMVDASVGGKTGVDLGALKNQVGVIVNPKMVLVDPQYLDTLPSEEYRSGYAEMLKHGLIQDNAYWNHLKDFKKISSEDIKELIHHSVGIKNKVVLEDPYEHGLRKILNFGHTLGHAIESYCLTQEDKNTLLHGEAIAIGMILEAYLSTKLTGLRQEESDEIKTVFNSIYPKIDFTPNEIEAILSLLQYDKKNSHGKVKFVLLEAIGKPVTDIEVPVALFQASFDYYKQ
ncbi:MAG: 3-dehydroquinate synthase [Flavobacteriaceae bacterium]|jgi:3-dehydroquinate synthase|nr:3-dehydroquinate synthase [Candidatus Arcticimaribacter sp.]